MHKHVLISCPQLQTDIESFQQIFVDNNITIETPRVNQQLTECDLLKIIDRFDGVIAGDDQFTDLVIRNAKRLQVISRWGVGIDGIDIESAKEHNIKIYNTPSSFNDEVADVVFGYMIMLSRQLHDIHQGVMQGDWPKPRGFSLKGKTIGIIGCGNTGLELSKRAFAAGMDVIGYDVRTIDPRTGITSVTLDTLLELSDFVSLNCNLTQSNVHMISFDQLARIKKNSYIINCARGPLINEDALIQALTSGRINGVALDVMEIEPLPSSSRLREFSNCIFGTHNSSNTHEAVARVNQESIKNLLLGLEILK